MKKYKNTEAQIVPGQDFVKPEVKNKKPSSHGEVANQKNGDFSELETSRMENPPRNRDTNGSDKSDIDEQKGNVEQEKGIR